jgi:hypothetical protein
MNDDADIDSTLASLDQQQTPATEEDPGIKATLDALDIPTAPKGGGKPSASATPTKPYQQTPLADRIIHAESGGNPNARAAGSSAGGLGQFIDSTWLPLLKKYRPDVAAGKSDQDLLALKNDPDLNKQMVNANIEENTRALNSAGVPVNDATLYGAHWFGPDNYAKIYHADPMTPIEDIIGKDAAMTNNLAGKTTDQAITRAAQKVGMETAGKDYTVGETMRLAGHNLLPSAVKTAVGIGHAVAHPSETWSTVRQLGDGILSKAESYADMDGDQTPEQKAQREQLVDALMDSYKEKYGTLQGFQDYIAHDPTGVALDASTLAGGVSVGATGVAKVANVAGKAAKVAGAAGLGAGLDTASNVASNVANVAHNTSILTNPISYVAGAIPNMSTKIVDATGKFVPKVDDLIQQATGGSMTAADIRDPVTKAAFLKTLQTKGVNLPAVKEALLKSLHPDMKAPTPTVTGTMTSASARDHVKQANAENNDLIGKVADHFGGPGSTADIGAALDKAHAASINRAANLYARIRTMPGTFGHALPDMPGLAKSIQGNWSRSGIPGASLDALIQSGHPQTAAAVKLLQNLWGQGRTLTRGGQFNGSEILAMRKALNGLRDAAQGSDIKGVGDVINAYDNHITGLSRRGLFVDPNTGSPVTNLGDTINAANKAYATHFNTYETMNGQNNPVVSAVRKLKSAQGRAPGGQAMPSGDTDLYTAAMGPMGKALLDPVKSADTYNSLMRATGNSPSVAAFVKSQLMDSVGKVKTPGNIAKVLADPNSAVAKALTPEELARARHIHAASVLNNTQPSFTSRLSSIAGGVLGRTLGKSAAAYLGHSAFGTVGAIAGLIGETALEHAHGALAERAAMKGAPKASKLKKAAQWAAQPRVVKNAATALHYTQDPSIQTTPPPIARASGGKVDEEALVTQLMKRWKAAKKATDETTKPLLKVPDAAIIKALDLAQEHL